MKKVQKIVATVATCVTLFGSMAVSASDSISAACKCRWRNCNYEDEVVLFALNSSATSDPSEWPSMTSRREKNNSTSVYFKVDQSALSAFQISVWGSKTENGGSKNYTLDKNGRKCDAVKFYTDYYTREFQIYNSVRESGRKYCELRGKALTGNGSVLFRWSPDTCSSCGTPVTVLDKK